jgi:hypothetical protein
MPRAMPGLGRVPHRDPRSEAYPLSVSTFAKARLEVARSLGLSKPRHWRQWKTFDQGQTPECTAFGSATFLAAAPIHPAARFFTTLDIHAWYAENQAEDRAHGRHFSEGATTLAAMEVGKRRGYWDRYEWAQSFEDLRTFVHNTAPIIVGLGWYDSMWDRDAEGIARITKTARLVGGHLFTINGYDPKRDLYRYPSTWGDGNYLLPGDVMRRLWDEDGEGVFPHELKVPV